MLLLCHLELATRCFVLALREFSLKLSKFSLMPSEARLPDRHPQRPRSEQERDDRDDKLRWVPAVAALDRRRSLWEPHFVLRCSGPGGHWW